LRIVPQFPAPVAGRVVEVADEEVFDVFIGVGIGNENAQLFHKTPKVIAF
jgi:hypothetical protein